MTAEDVERVEAAIFAWRVAGDDSVNAMLGILYVLRRRVQSGENHGSWLENIAASYVHEPGTRSITTYPDVRDQQFVQIYQLVDGVYDGTRNDNLTGEAMYWSRSGRFTPLEVIKDPEKHPRTGVVGTVTFFK